MSLRQEAIALLDAQTDEDIEIIVALLRSMARNNGKNIDATRQTIPIVGAAKGLFTMPSDEEMRRMDAEIAQQFYGESV